MIDHVSLRVNDFAKMLAFYRAALEPIGYRVMMEFPDATGLGKDGMPDFWLTRKEQQLNPTHLAFKAERSGVDAFHSAALAAGASDNGGPGVRADYHPHYYAAYVFDPEGNNVEVVCHADPDAPPPAAAAPKAARKAKPKKSAKPAGKSASKKSAKKAAKKAKGKKRR